MTAKLFFCGDTHGKFDVLRKTVEAHRPDAVILLGDVQPQRALERELDWLAGETELWFIHGNHDTDTEGDYDRLLGSAWAHRNLDGRVAEIAGLRIAGLGGIFRSQIWMPPEEPAFTSTEDFIRRMGKGNTWRGGLPLRHRSTIFPDVWQSLAEQRADILVTHEAPCVHPNGMESITQLARRMRVGKLFHGHQHDCLDYASRYDSLGFEAHGVGLRGISDQRGCVIVPGELDGQRSVRLLQQACHRTPDF